MQMFQLCARFRPAFVARFLRFKSTDNGKSSAAAAEWQQIVFQTEQKVTAPATEIDLKKDYFVADENMTFEQLKEIISQDELGKIENFQKEYEKILLTSTEAEKNKYPPSISVRDWVKFLRHPHHKDNVEQFVIDLKDAYRKQFCIYQTIEDLRASLSLQDSVRLNRAMQELELASYLDSRLPTRISPDHCYEILKLKSPTERLRYFRFLGNTEMKKERQMANKVQKLNDPNYQPRVKEGSGQHYSRSDCRELFRLYERDMLHIQDYRVRHALIMGKPTVCVDTSYMHSANVSLRNLTAKQLHQAYCVNRAHRSPCQLLFTDADLSADFWAKYLKTSLGFLRWPKMAGELTSKSFLDLFPRERLVYLTSDSRQELHKFDEDDVYILGAMVDKYQTGVRASIGRAKQFGIRHCRLPLDSYVQWPEGVRGTNLTLGQVLGILLDVHLSGDWKSAIWNNVPRRKLVRPEHWMERAERARQLRARDAFVLESWEQ